MFHCRLICSLLTNFASVFLVLFGAPYTSAQQDTTFFEKKIRPLLIENCLDCHQTSDPAGGLSLETKSGWQRGGDSGPAIVPHDPASSLLIRAVSYADPDLKMPPPDSGTQLSRAQIEDLTLWIRQGAVDPRTGHAVETDIDRRARQHWAFQPLQSTLYDAKLSESKTTKRHPIDLIVEQKLDEHQFQPTQRADIRTLVRRATYDLHGLPPTEDHMATTMEDFPRLIDELLMSPRYGERWARHWLDVARYSDAKDGVLMYGDARVRPFAYTYRDYVIRAFNKDKPFDRFVKEQLAADQLGLPPHSPDLAAMGFLTLGRMFDLNRHDVIDDQIDVVTRGFLGLTAACARCHDHKFDPIPTADYYSLYGVFASSIEPYEQPRIETVSTEAEAFEVEFGRLLNTIAQTNQTHYDRTLEIARERTADYLVQVATTDPDLAETAIYFKSLLPEQLRPQIIHRWRELIARRAFPDDPVFGPWYDLMRSQELQPQEWQARGIDTRVIEALVQAKPTSREEVARAYGKLFRDVYQLHRSTEKQLAQANSELTAIKNRQLDLADIVGGGNGMGTGQTGVGIHPNTGQQTSGETGFIESIETNKLVPVPHLPFVDGVFVPQGERVVASSTGVHISGLRASSGKSWDYFKYGPSSGFTVTTIDSVDFASAPHSMLSIHANKGITFDLEAMRNEYGFGECHFTCLLGNLGAKGESELDFAVYLDGKREVDHQDVASQQSGIPVKVRIARQCRFLTIVVTEGARGISHDQAVLGDPKIVIAGKLDSGSKLLQRQQEVEMQIAKVREQQASLLPPERDPLAALLLTQESPIWFPIHQIETYLSRQDRDAYRGLVNQLDAVAVQHPEAPARALTLQDSRALYDPVIFQRGDPSQPGAPVPRAFLQCLSNSDRPVYEDASGRLELAEEIVANQNPLTARVWVNRIWMHHFGTPLVEDPSDFGLRTEKPIQHELLDFLARTLIESGWRTKPLHRLIMTSEVWQRSSLIPQENPYRQQLLKDAENELLWRAERRRLDLEQMRDSLLFTSGQLDTTMYGRPLAITDLANHRRTIYAFVERQNIPNVVQVFDFANADASTGKRPETTVPQQALFAMNSPIVQQAAAQLAGKVSADQPIESQVQELFQHALKRAPNELELKTISQFLADRSLVDLAQVLLMSNEFMFID